MLRHFLAAIGIVVVTGSLAAGQAPAGGGQRAGGPPAPMKNLQVLPKDMAQPEVVAMMRTFNTALGVDCGHCHVWTKPGDPGNDMAADTKTTKAVARVMMQMTNDINTKLAASIKKPAAELTRVACATCHRGAAIPVVPPPAAATPAPPTLAPVR